MLLLSSKESATLVHGQFLALQVSSVDINGIELQYYTQSLDRHGAIFG